MTKDNEKKTLSEREEDRLDGLLSSARRFHNLNFILAGLALALSSLDEKTYLSLPVGGIKLPYQQTAVGIYLMSLTLTFSTLRLFNMAYRWLEHDSRRPPFPWFVLRSQKTSHTYVFVWALIPFFICITPLVALSGANYRTISLILPGFILLNTPEYIASKIYEIRNRVDENENKMTFSIYILYWIRLIRHFCIIVIFTTPILGVVPRWSDALLKVASITIIIMIPLGIISLVGPFIYKWLDKIGTKYGFSSDYPYKK